MKLVKALSLVIEQQGNHLRLTIKENLSADIYMCVCTRTSTPALGAYQNMVRRMNFLFGAQTIYTAFYGQCISQV